MAHRRQREAEDAGAAPRFHPLGRGPDRSTPIEQSGRKHPMLAPGGIDPPKHGVCLERRWNRRVQNGTLAPPRLEGAETHSDVARLASAAHHMPDQPRALALEQPVLQFIRWRPAIAMGEDRDATPDLCQIERSAKTRPSPGRGKGMVNLRERRDPGAITFGCQPERQVAVIEVEAIGRIEAAHRKQPLAPDHAVRSHELQRTSRLQVGNKGAAVSGRLHMSLALRVHRRHRGLVGNTVPAMNEPDRRDDTQSDGSANMLAKPCGLGRRIVVNECNPVAAGRPNALVSGKGNIAVIDGNGLDLTGKVVASHGVERRCVRHHHNLEVSIILLAKRR